MATRSRRAVAVLALALGLSAAVAGAQPCPGIAIDRTFTAGARWQVCLEEQAVEGFVLVGASFTAAGSPTALRVLDRASLAQVHVAWDDDRARLAVLSTVGLGGGNLESLSVAECEGGTVRTSNGRPVLCERVRARHYAYKYYGSHRLGQALELWSSARAYGLVLVPRWTLHDDGTIEPAVGLSGVLSELGDDPQHGWPIDAGGTIAVSASITYHWRIDADLGASGSDDTVEELELPAANTSPTDSGSLHRLVKTTLAAEAARPLDLAVKRWWRIVDSATNADGHRVSYQLQPLHAGYRYQGPGSEPWSGSAFAVTVERACERLASDNVHPCGGDVMDYVNSESLAGADPVLWHAISIHFLPRDEDQPAIPLRFDGFALEPRDAWATNPLGGGP